MFVVRNVANLVPPYTPDGGHHATSARYFAQEMNWGNAAIGKINSVLHGLEADIKAGLVSVSSPLARALIGKSEGDMAEVLAPVGKREYAVVSVAYQ